jgi:Tfp pilus assembly protein PilX
MNRKNEKGVALILALILLLIISVMAVSLMFISQTETWSSMNYRLMSQARDGAEAGVNAAANYIINTYTPPSSSGTDLFSNYNNATSPVQYPAANSGNHDVILSTNSSHKSYNYPVSSVETAFQSAAQGSLTAGSATVNYATYATLLRQDQVLPYGSASNVTVQTWQITSDGTIGGIRSADEEVSAILEKQVWPVFSYAAFATGQGCGAMNFGGGGGTASYDSANLTLSGGVPVVSATGGNVGTNGNLAENGNPTSINGNLSTPRTGTGTCSSGNVTAWTDSGGTVTGGLVQLPQQVVYQTPATPSPVPPTTSITLDNMAGDCGGVVGCTYGTGALPAGNGCPSGDFCLAPGTCPPLATGPGVYGNLTIKGTVHMYNTLSTGTPPVDQGCYNINSLIENGGGTLTIDKYYPTGTTTLTSGSVVINVAGSGTSTPIDLTGGGLINNTGFNADMLQIIYGGTGTVNVKGGANAVGVLYAPNANLSFNSAGGNWYGAVITGTMSDLGHAQINYDVNLQRQDVTVSNWMLDSFTWKKN